MNFEIIQSFNQFEQSINSRLERNQDLAPSIVNNSSKQINLIIRPSAAVNLQLDAIKYARNSAAVTRCRY